ncbi:MULTISPECIES: methylated-DNA--[protein]-cysteine S-methyltransferase [Bradyrhizobium]|jgi:AraC family transcriptional regulator of adaptative response/methylated-DNA-[protein]-cysteine methyltransferase|uniref:AraC family transcriptional regulator, regulatory protein of adaptative response / methylated-DNA-[protein]-cysteine methyltransferase n=1 Tax=Bradyrhizobium ottawaense TaxID=931866 RepID=A0ABY0QDS1_9BRAD|nr:MULTISPECIES: methylated-DNA--[protein]-cysteine S-methyltransferase [Bradyrhizobium]SDJ98346.1 AraC family transcriptional regulator, regulatory protein of adaptative response / methylated-DNA-[protein]-cysteine methyltransferase [Bradyrhizobium ottawaense]SHM63245.1 O-6-methylguanine DNA methyltransferase [Bradyrhizobium lablabi]
MNTPAPNTTEPEILLFGYGETELGQIVVAETRRGVAALFLGEDRAKLFRDLEQAFPCTRLVLDQAALETTISRAISMIDTPRAAVELPLDLRGSPIEMAVWKALMSIPIGETRTYGQIAKNLPIAATAQEVGAACAANRIAVAVPCHRVVKADGSVAGYRWGVKRKLRLINREGIDL